MNKIESLIFVITLLTSLEIFKFSKTLYNYLFKDSSKVTNKNMAIAGFNLFMFLFLCAIEFLIYPKIFMEIFVISMSQVFFISILSFLSELFILKAKVKRDKFYLVFSIITLSLSGIVFYVGFDTLLNFFIKMNNDYYFYLLLIGPFICLVYYIFKIIKNIKESKIEDIDKLLIYQDKKAVYFTSCIVFLIFTLFSSIFLLTLPDKPLKEVAIHNLKFQERSSIIPIERNERSNENILKDMILAAQNGQLLFSYSNNITGSEPEIKIIDEEKLSVVSNENVEEDHLEISSKAILKDPNYDYLNIKSYNKKDNGYDKKIHKLMKDVDEPKYTIYLK